MHLYDSLSGQTRQLPKDFVTIYACGITPYSRSHVGHARTYVVFDTLARVLRLGGRQVRLVRNITDIDDKIIARAEQEGIQWYELSDKWSQINRELMRKTGLHVPEEPKASEHLDSIFKLIQTLLDKNAAYLASTGDVNFRTTSWTGPLLIGHEAENLRSGADSRVNTDGKEHPADFALWKRMDADAVGFESPWGWGRPGWHIECSAMINELLGGSVTIHGGGADLKFPHHQAEIMQSETASGKPLASVWMHNGSVLVNRKKMSKSLGNDLSWEQALTDATEIAGATLGGALLRASVLQTHWSQPLDWTPRLLPQTFAMMQTLTQQLPDVQEESDGELRHKALQMLDENFNVPAFFVWLQDQRKKGNIKQIQAGLDVLGLQAVRWAKPAAELNDYWKAIQIEHKNARLAKNFTAADELRAHLLSNRIPLLN